ncbi:hypothetical protein SAMN05421639_104363 [Chryseobacterium shigense]|uniref:Uncharacterized protein n=1 Tax=Chryseobacterium shigense TaxID=297244 RepID=A0A1N7IPW6_9FLAO|nr:hypothetical protein SAMN05421639_104363 [Chryseobacterium shigense]
MLFKSDLNALYWGGVLHLIKYIESFIFYNAPLLILFLLPPYGYP